MYNQLKENLTESETKFKTINTCRKIKGFKSR